jgi:tetratricopeptide (TPR) repeat protein
MDDRFTLPCEVTTESPDAQRAMERVAFGWCAHRADTASHLHAALEADPDLVLGRVLEGFGARLLARRDLLADARSKHAHAQRSLSARGGTRSEAAFVRALGASCDGDPERAVAELESILDREPTNALAVKLSHAIQFMIGESEGMRASLQRVLPAFRGQPGHGLVLGCYAFSLIETGAAEEGERVGRAAVDLEPLDAWGFHAVMHALLIQGRNREGAAFAGSRGDRFTGCTNFAGHIAWHEALFHVALGDYDRALELHDREIAIYPARDYRDVANASSLLYRLERAGVSVGSRWDGPAQAAKARFGDHESAFADAHYALALAGSGQLALARLFAGSMRVATQDRHTFEAAVSRGVGLDAVEGIVALAAGRSKIALDRFSSCASDARRLGGSEAQRDLFEELHADAALAAGDHRIARDVASQRLARRPADVWAAALLDDHRARARA